MKTIFKFAAVAMLMAGNANAQAVEDCGYENGVSKYCGNGFGWVWGQDSYAVAGNHIFGSHLAPDVEWEFASGGWIDSARSCEQNPSGVFVAAPNITIKEAESVRYRNLYFALPVTVMMETPKFLPEPNSIVFNYELQANGKTLIGPLSMVMPASAYDSKKKYAVVNGKITGHTEIKNEELKNVKLVIYDLIQKVDPSKSYYCYQFNVLLGKGRIDLLQ